MAYSNIDNSEESSFSNELLSEELTNLWDRGNEQNWLKGRKSRDPDSIADINEFLRMDASNSVIDDSNSVIDDSTIRATDDNSAGNLNDTFIDSNADPCVVKFSNVSCGSPIFEQTLIENVSPPNLYYKSHELTLSATPSPPKYLDESNNRSLRNLDTSLEKTTSHFFNNDIGSDVSPKSMSAKTPDHVEHVRNPSSSTKISDSKITHQSMNMTHQIIKEDLVDEFQEIPELDESLVGTHENCDPVEDLSRTFSFENSIDETVVAQHGSDFSSEENAAKNAQQATCGDLDMILCSGDKVVQHCYPRFDTFSVPPPGIFLLEESEREFIAQSQPETNQCQSVESTKTCETSNSNDFLLVSGLEESLTSATPVGTHENCDAMALEDINTTLGFESSFNETVIAQNGSDCSFEKEAANHGQQHPFEDLDINSCSGEQEAEHSSSILPGRRLLRCDTFILPPPGLFLFEKSERKSTAQSQPETNQCLAVEFRETREKDQLHAYEFLEVSCLEKTLSSLSLENGSNSVDNKPFILENSCDETLLAQSKSYMISVTNTANHEQQQRTDQHHNDAGEINFGSSWNETALITQNGSENRAGNNVQQPARGDLDISSSGSGPVRVSCGSPIPRHVMPLGEEDNELIARCHPDYDQCLTVESGESGIRADSGMKNANNAQKSEYDDLGVIPENEEPVKILPFGKEEQLAPRAAVESGEIRGFIDPSSGTLQVRQRLLGHGGAVSKPPIRTTDLDRNSNARLETKPPDGDLKVRHAKGAPSKIPVRKCPLLRSGTVLHSMSAPSKTRSLSKITPSPSLPNLSTSLNPARKPLPARGRKS